MNAKKERMIVIAWPTVQILMEITPASVTKVTLATVGPAQV